MRKKKKENEMETTESIVRRNIIIIYTFTSLVVCKRIRCMRSAPIRDKRKWKDIAAIIIQVEREQRGEDGGR